MSMPVPLVPDSRGTPGVFRTFFFNHARRLRLEKKLYPELFRSPNGGFKPVAVR
jgi:hypothetical protein